MATTSNPFSLTPDEDNTDPAFALMDNNQAGTLDIGQTGPGGGTPNPGGIPSPVPHPAPVGNPDTAGITDTAANPPGIVTGAMSSYTPTLGTVSDKETVAGHVNDLLNKDNPIMQTARSQSAQAANSRGLLNSSMAVQAGEQAAINSALPIATQDASTYHDTAVRNQAASNEGGQFNAGAENQSKLLGQSGQQEQALQTLRGGQASSLSAQQAGQEQTLQQLRGDQATNIANIEANYKTLMQTSASATQLFSETVKTIGALLDDPNTTAEQKQAGIDKQIALLQSGLGAIGSTGNVDLTSLLDFSKVSPPPAAAPTTPAAPAEAAPGQPAPPNTLGAGGNVGDVVYDATSGHDVRIKPDGSFEYL